MTALTKVPETELWTSFPEVTRNDVLGLLCMLLERWAVSPRPAPARQPSIRRGRYWIFLSLRLTMRTRPSTSAAAKLAMDRFSSDQMPSAGLSSGAYAGSR